MNDPFFSPEGTDWGGVLDGEEEESPGNSNDDDYGEGNHADRRDAYCRILWDHAESLRRFGHDERARVGAVTAMVRMATHGAPIRNAAQAREVYRVGDRLVELFEALPSVPTTERGKFSTAALAMVSVLYEENGLVGMGDLIARAGKRLESGRCFASLAQITEQPGSCVAWAQMTPLLEAGSLGWVKKRQRKALAGGCAFELTDEGRRKAGDVIRKRRGVGSEQRGALRSWGLSGASFFVAVDDREGGGDRHSLGALCRRLELEKVPHETRTLRSGDYLFVRKRDGEFCGQVVERKTAVDLADSIRDGRWQHQYRSMEKTFIDERTSLVTKIVYLVEGKPEHFVHTACGCGCRGVGRCGNPTVDECRAALAQKESLPFVEVKRVNDERASARYLASCLASLASLEEPTTTKRPNVDHSLSEKRQKTPPKKSKKPPALTSDLRRAAEAWAEHDVTTLGKFTLPTLKALCQATGATMSGSKKDLLVRLLEPPEPAILAKRRLQEDLYVPRDKSCGHAILCALEKAERNGQVGLTKDILMNLAEKTGVCATSLYEQVGPMGYDGWSCAKDLVGKGEPPICQKKKNLYSLRTYSAVSQNGIASDSGRDVAIALHFKAHQRGYCQCNDPPPESLPQTKPTTVDDICAQDQREDDIRSFLPAATVAAVKKPCVQTPPTAVRRKNKPPPLTGDTDFDDLWENRSQQPSVASDDDDSIVDLTQDSPLKKNQPPSTPKPTRHSLVDLTADSP